jgi:hypothetical protein
VGLEDHILLCNTIEFATATRLHTAEKETTITINSIADESNPESQNLVMGVLILTSDIRAEWRLWERILSRAAFLD